MFENIINEVKTEILDQVTAEIYDASVRQSATLIFLALRNETAPANDERSVSERLRDQVEQAVRLAISLDEELGRQSE